MGQGDKRHYTRILPYKYAIVKVKHSQSLSKCKHPFNWIGPFWSGVSQPGVSTLEDGTSSRDTKNFIATQSTGHFTSYQSLSNKVKSFLSKSQNTHTNHIYPITDAFFYSLLVTLKVSQFFLLWFSSWKLETHTFPHPSGALSFLQSSFVSEIVSPHTM